MSSRTRSGRQALPTRPRASQWHMAATQEDSRRSAGLRGLAAFAAALATAVSGGLVGGYFALGAVDRGAAANRETGAIELKREALDQYAQAYTATMGLASDVFVDSWRVANEELSVDSSIMAQRVSWHPEMSFRLDAGLFSEVQSLEAASARLKVLFSAEVNECTDRILHSVYIQFWEFDALATGGEFEWFGRTGTESDDDSSQFSGLFATMRGNLYRTLVDHARQEVGLSPLSDGADMPDTCSTIPYYVADSSTQCDEAHTGLDCLELTADIWERVQSYRYTPEDLL